MLRCCSTSTVQHVAHADVDLGSRYLSHFVARPGRLVLKDLRFPRLSPRTLCAALYPPLSDTLSRIDFTTVIFQQLRPLQKFCPARPRVTRSASKPGLSRTRPAVPPVDNHPFFDDVRIARLALCPKVPTATSTCARPRPGSPSTKSTCPTPLRPHRAECVTKPPRCR